MGKHLLTNIGVGALIIDNQDNSVLLTKKNYGIFKDKWMFAEGYVDEGENIIEAVKREVKEELNGEIKINGLVGVRSGQAQNGEIVYFIFNCDLLNKNELKINNKKEIAEFKFIKLTDIENNQDVYSLVKEVINKSKSNLKKVDFLPSELELNKKDYLLYL